MTQRTVPPVSLNWLVLWRSEENVLTTDMIFDSHAHLCDAKFDEDRDAVIRGLPAKGVQGFTEVGFDLPSSKSAVTMALKYPSIYAAVGFHPDHSDCLTAEALDALRRLIKEHRDVIVAVGEIGLDYHYTRDAIRRRAENDGREATEEELAGADPEASVQKQCFRMMLTLAAETGLPINVHTRDAAKDTYDMIVAEKGYRNGGIIHCFGYSKEVAAQYVKLGMCIGIGGVVTFKNSKKIKEVVRETPIDHIVLETDCPYMSPVPLRGTRNDPGNLPYVAQTIAELKDMCVEEVIRITTENAQRVYRIK